MVKNVLSFCRPLIERFPRAASAYRAARDSQHAFMSPKPTAAGFLFGGNQAMEEGTFEPIETGLVRRLLGKNDVMINIGANIGYYCCIALAHRKRVVAFEPVQSNLELLYKNIAANGWENEIEVYPIALSDKPGLVDIYGAGTGASLIRGWAGTSTAFRRLVPCSTIDAVLTHRFRGDQCFVLVDIEGAEDMMLEGAKGMLEKEPKPVWMVEISRRDHQPNGRMNPSLQKTFQRFWKLGYEAWTADERCQQVTRDDIDQVIAGGTDRLITRNFLFLEQGREGFFLGEL